MPDVGRFLERLGAEAGKGLSPLETEALVAEARDHLESSIQARLELGMGREEAEAEAIAAFGSARALTHEPWIDRRLLLTSFAILAYWATCTGSLPNWLSVPVVGAFFVLHGLFVVNSARTRRFQAATLAVILLPLWLLWSSRGAMENVWVAGSWEGYDRIPRAEVLDRARSVRETGVRMSRGAALLREEYARFRRGELNASPARSVSFHEDGRPRLFPREDLVLAERRWQAALRTNGVASAKMSRTSLNEQAAGMEAALRGPWWLGLHHEAAYSFAASGWAVGSIYLALHAWGWAFGVALRRRKPRSGRGARRAS